MAEIQEGSKVARVERDSDVFVASLPRRQAHALYALFAASRELRMPPTAAEMVYYDAEAFSARGTAAALREAAQKGLCICAGGAWFALGDALHIGERAFERRFLADTDDALTTEAGNPLTPEPVTGRPVPFHTLLDEEDMAVMNEQSIPDRSGVVCRPTEGKPE